MNEISAIIKKRQMIEPASSLCSPPYEDTMEKTAVCKLGTGSSSDNGLGVALISGI